MALDRVLLTEHIWHPCTGMIMDLGLHPEFDSTIQILRRRQALVCEEITYRNYVVGRIWRDEGKVFT